LPGNMFLSILGGIIGFLGIYIIHTLDLPILTTKKK
jgi:ABC-type cobalamin transport system permease subunit